MRFVSEVALDGAGRMTKYLIVNADGYGFTRGINRGIEAATERGIITSISVNSNYEGIDELPAFAARFPQVSVGVHLNPVVGPPVADPAAIPTLLGPDGEFLGGREFTRRLLARKIEKSELKHELRLQVERVRDMGIPISHLDSHQNRHLYPRYFGVFLELHGRDRRALHAHARALRAGRVGAAAQRSAPLLPAPSQPLRDAHDGARRDGARPPATARSCATA